MATTRRSKTGMLGSQALTFLPVGGVFVCVCLCETRTDLFLHISLHLTHKTPEQFLQKYSTDLAQEAWLTQTTKTLLCFSWLHYKKIVTEK